jgi:hypothetical protein
MISVMRTSPCVGFGAPEEVPPLLDVEVPPLLEVDVPPLLDDVDVPPLLDPPLLDDVDVPPLLDPPLLDPPLLDVDGVPLLEVVSSSSGAGSFAGTFCEPSAREGSPLPSTPGRFGSTCAERSGVSVDAQAAATQIVAKAAS